LFKFFKILLTKSPLRKQNRNGLEYIK